MEPWMVAVICLTALIFVISIVTLVLTGLNYGDDSSGCFDASHCSCSPCDNDSDCSCTPCDYASVCNASGGVEYHGEDLQSLATLQYTSGSTKCGTECCSNGVFRLFYYAQKGDNEAKPWKNFIISSVRYVNCDGWVMGCNTIADASCVDDSGNEDCSGPNGAPRSVGAPWECSDGDCTDPIGQFTMQCEIQLPYMCLSSKMYTTEVNSGNEAVFGVGSVVVTYANLDTEKSGTATIYLMNDTSYQCDDSKLRSGAYGGRYFADSGWPSYANGDKDYNWGYEWVPTGAEDVCTNCTCSSGADADPSGCYLASQIDNYYQFCNEPYNKFSAPSGLKTNSCDIGQNGNINFYYDGTTSGGWTIYCDKEEED